MTKNNLTAIIVLMSLASVGLLWLQASWIRDALRINREQFERDVIQAMAGVSDKLEQRELAALAWQNMEMEANPEIYFFSDTATTERKDQRHRKNHLRKKKIKREVTAVRKEIYLNLGVADSQAVCSDTQAIMLPKTPLPPDELPPYIDLQRFARRSAAVNRVFQRMMFTPPDIPERINPVLLDSLLLAEISTRGIESPFEYAIEEADSDQLLVTKAYANELALRQTSLRIPLFSNDLVSRRNFLLIHFPLQTEIIWKRTANTLVASVLLLAVVIGCFTVSVRTIMRQKKLSEMKDDFINNMTHEFKTPVATISLACEALQDPDMAANENIRMRYLHIIGDENKRMSRQIEKVLQTARLERGEWELNRESIDTHTLLNEVITNMTMQIEAANGNIHANLQATDYQIFADKIHFVSVLQNLLDNANKYSPKGANIGVSTYNEGGKWVLQISDEGVGMTSEQVKKIFDKFYRVPKGNLHDVKGFGLGLNYVKNITQAHGATITVKSSPQKGSTFTVYWPLETPNQQAT